MHTVAVLALPDTIAFDLATPVEVFGRVELAAGLPGYRVLVCGTDPVVSAGALRIGTDHGLDALAAADTIVVPGRNDVTGATPPAVITVLRDAFARGARIASICTGACTLAAAGLLDGRRATTHWQAADTFRAAFPAVCLDAARLAVAPLHRSGGQAQFILRNRRGRQAPQKSIAERTELDDVLSWIEREAHRELALGDIAAHAAVSVRTLNRRFAAETGQTPMQWLAGVRIRHAQQMLETTGYGVERVGREVGFTSPTNFREQFRRLTGVSPQSYRSTFRERIAG